MARKPVPSCPPWKSTQLLKNLDQNGLLWKKLEHFEIGRPKILRSKNLEFFQQNFYWKYSWEIFRSKKNIFIQFSMNIFEIFEIIKFRNFLISKFFIFIQFQWSFWNFRAFSKNSKKFHLKKIFFILLQLFLFNRFEIFL